MFYEHVMKRTKQVNDFLNTVLPPITMQYVKVIKMIVFRID